MIVSDNCTALTSLAIVRWLMERDVEWHHIAPSQSSTERVCRQLSARLRDECHKETILPACHLPSQGARGLEERLQLS